MQFSNKQFQIKRAGILPLFMLMIFVHSAFGQAVTDTSRPPGSDPIIYRRGFFLGILPDFRTVSRKQKSVSAMSSKQKFSIAFRDMIDPGTILLAGAIAGAAQGFDTDPQYEKGASGYFKRVGAFEANIASNDFFVVGLLPSVLHHDPRFFQKGPGTSAWSRIKYAATRTVITRTDTGKTAFNYSELGGVAASIALTNAYYPDDQRTASLNAQRYAINLAVRTGFNVLREFTARRWDYVYDNPATQKPPRHF